ncbi:MAG: precorrin-8X methylmutase [Sciscionella sp.]
MPHPIEVQSYAILRSRVDTATIPPLRRAVIERVIHTTADPSWVGEIHAAEADLQAGRTALSRGAPVVVDVRMLAAGISSRDPVIGLDLPEAEALATAEGLTRSAAGIRAAAQRHPEGAIWAIGNAPTALHELVRLIVAGTVVPALVIGVPVGFVGSVAAKSELRACGAPALTTLSERGGAAIAAAAVNALLYHDDPEAHAAIAAS